MNLCFFDMAYDPKRFTFILSFHEAFVKAWESLNDETLLNLARHKIVNHDFFKKFGGESDIDLESDSLATKSFLKNFENIFRNIVVKSDWLKWSKNEEYYQFEILMPEYTILTRNKCKSCSGKKFDAEYYREFKFKMPCRVCFGSGKEGIDNSKTFQEFVNFLTLLFDLSNNLAFAIPDNIQTQKPLLVYPRLSSYAEQDVIGIFTEQLAEYLIFQIDNQSDQAFSDKVIDVMLKAYARSSGTPLEKCRRDEYFFSFQKSASESSSVHWYLQVPGQNGCSLHSYGMSSNPTKGCEKIHPFSCHNIDTVAQQIALFTGLAYICTEARLWLEASEDKK